MKLSKKQTETDGVYYTFWCIACQCLHTFWCDRPDGKRPSWSFDGNENSPTFHPSLLQYIDQPNGREVICHLILADGKLKYCSDNPKFPGQEFDLQDIPDNQQVP
jgi:hypothetical protein